MSRGRTAPLETARVREVVGIFCSPEALRAAVDDLLLAGFDRASLDLIGCRRPLRRYMKNSSTSFDQLARSRCASRGAVVRRDDIFLVRALLTGIFGFLAGAIVAAVTVALNGNSLVVAGMVIAGCTAGALGGYALARYLKPNDLTAVDAELAKNGVMLWVRVLTPKQETAAVEILTARGAQDVRAVETDAVKCVDDIPLSALQPDPFIPVRLGDL